MENTKLQHVQQLKQSFLIINEQLIKSGYEISKLRDVCVAQNNSVPFISGLLIVVLVILTSVFVDLSIIVDIFVGTRCILPNNYFIWEATRPISNCQFCMNVTQPIILSNVTREEFAYYAYSSKPIIIKNAVQHWTATKKFSFNYLKQLYDSTEGSYESVEEDCQFLHFHSDFTTLRDVFAMSETRAKYSPGEKSWYVGWCNCNQEILNKMRKYYPIPHFLPVDSELSNREYIFMGYDQGANMHLDFISRLMWQAQLIGNKTWHLIPSPECENVCNSLSFYVEPGDASKYFVPVTGCWLTLLVVLLDTRVWYHGTTIAKGEFSLTIQSEYS